MTHTRTTSRAWTRLVKMRDAVGFIKANPQQVGSGSGWCLMNVRTALGVPAKYPTAYAAWLGAGGAAGAYTHTQIKAPAGVPVFYKGTASAGHIAIADHHDATGALWVWTTDWKGAHHWTLVRSADLAKRWGMKYLGWSETLNGVRVHAHVSA